jgi:hypothetical protein
LKLGTSIKDIYSIVLEKRVLILHSFKDKSYEVRLQQIVNNPDLDEISFRHCCVIDRDRGSIRIMEMDRLGNQTYVDWDKINAILSEVLKKEIGPLLDQQITEFDPEVVIIHGGTIFNAVPGACITMTMDLMEKHPGLPFAMEGKSEFLSRRIGKPPPTLKNIFEERMAINQERWVRHNFINDDEIEEIIKAVFG